MAFRVRARRGKRSSSRWRRSAAQQRAREARRATVALRELLAAVGQDLGPGSLQADAGARVALHSKCNAGGEGEHVRPQRLELLVGNGDDFDRAFLEELGEPR